MNRIAVAMGMGCLLLSGSALAQNYLEPPDRPFYVGAKYEYQELDPDGASDADFDVLSLRAGLHLTPHLSGEFRWGYGVSDDEIGNTDVDMDNYYGFYGRGGLPNETPFTPYILLGWTEARFDFDPPGSGSTSDSTDGFSYGIGAAYHVDEAVSLDVEYLRLLDQDDSELDAVTLGVNVHF